MAEKQVWNRALLAINKYKHVTCAKLVDELKPVIYNGNEELEKILKVGHGGTLDETATGVLVVGIGFGCKLLPYFLNGCKTYKVVGCLGIETDTLNDTGKVVRTMPFSHVTSENLICKLKTFVGDIMQTPPEYSALKSGGRRFSDLALEGQTVPVKPRHVKCYSAQLIYFDPPKFSLEVSCGGGFYIRSLIRDLGYSVGACAHVIDLHRSRQAFLTDENCVDRENWTYNRLLENCLAIQEMKEYRDLLELFASFSRHKRKQKIWIDPT